MDEPDVYYRRAFVARHREASHEWRSGAVILLLMCEHAASKKFHLRRILSAVHGVAIVTTASHRKCLCAEDLWCAHACPLSNKGRVAPARD